MSISVTRSRIEKADRTHVTAAMAGFANKPSADWLGAAHPVANGALPADWDGVRALEPARIVEAVAASAPNHCIDGWSNAARAMSALVAGDPHGARHLAYYGQLRAALCILANVGIGIFDGINVAIDATGQIDSIDQRPNGQPPQRRGAGTHTAVWDALEIWASTPAHASSFLEMLRFRGTSISEIIRLIWPGYDETAVSSDLIARWGVDLAAGRRDKEFRNTSSYYPHALNPVAIGAEQTADFIRGVWAVFEPSGGNNFDFLDRHLLKRLLQSQHDLFSDAPGAYGDGPIGSKYDHLPEHVRRIASLEFLGISASEDQPLVLSLAEEQNESASPSEMIARSLMLLRIATAFTHSNFIDSGLAMGTDSLRPWLDEVAAARGFWVEDEPVEQLSDLWLDVECELEEFQNVTVLPLLGGKPMLAAKRLPVVTEAERIGLWSLTA